MKITKTMVDKFREYVSQVGMPHAEKELGISQQTLWNWMNKKFPEDPRGSNAYKFLAWYESKFSMNRAADEIQVARIPVYGIAMCKSWDADFVDIAPDIPASDLEFFPVPKELQERHPRMSAFRAEGDSMADKINHGDICFIDPDAEVQTNNFVLCKFDGVVVCKKWYPVGDMVLLRSVNTKYEDLQVKKSEIEWRCKVTMVLSFN